MTRTAAVAVVGGGVIGASVAYHLALKGMRDVVILDQGIKPGEGSTGKATGGFRAQFATSINVRLSLESRERLINFKDETGIDSGYNPVGYLWIAYDDRQLSALRNARTVQVAGGLAEAIELDPNDVAGLNPFIETRGIVGGAFCPSDGYIEPLQILRGFLEAGERLGVQSSWGTRVTGFESRGSRIHRIRTSDGDIDAEFVVNAAGPWASGVAAQAGVTLPVTPLRRQAAVTEPVTSISPQMPMTIFMDTGFHFRPRHGRALLCWPTPDDKHVAGEVDEEWVRSVRAMTEERVPALREVAIDRSRCYSGLYEMSPDHHAIVGFAAERENMFLVNGSSGHGVMHSPALGAFAAEVICGDAPSIDLHELRPSRFAEGKAIATTELL